MRIRIPIMVEPESIYLQVAEMDLDPKMSKKNFINFKLDSQSKSSGFWILSHDKFLYIIYFDVIRIAV